MWITLTKKGDEYKRTNVVSSNGWIEEFYDTDEECSSALIVPGTSLLPNDLQDFSISYSFCTYSWVFQL